MTDLLLDLRTLRANPFVPAVRARIRAIDPNIVQYDIRTITARVREWVVGRRLLAACLPARRATTINPTDALRQQ